MLLAATRRLPLPQREVIILVLEGFSYAEIAEMLGEPLGTIKTRMRKGMMKLVSLLSDA